MINSDKSKRLVVIKNIKYLRELNNLSTQELSKMLNKKEYFIEKLEANLYKREPTLETIEELSKIFNVSTDIILRQELNK